MVKQWMGSTRPSTEDQPAIGCTRLAAPVRFVTAHALPGIRAERSRPGDSTASSPPSTTSSDPIIPFIMCFNTWQCMCHSPFPRPSGEAPVPSPCCTENRKDSAGPNMHVSSKLPPDPEPGRSSGRVRNGCRVHLCPRLISRHPWCTTITGFNWRRSQPTVRHAAAHWGVARRSNP